MIDLDTPCLVKGSHQVPLFNVPSAVMIGASLLTGRDQAEGYEIYDRDVLEFQLRIISDPDFSKQSVAWQRFSAYETVSLFELIDREFGGGDDSYLKEFFVPEMLEHERTDNDDHSGPDTWQVFHLEDRAAFEAQVKLLGIGEAPPAPRGNTLKNYTRSYLSTIESPHEVNPDSPEFKDWLDGEADRLAHTLAGAVEAFVSHDLGPPPEKE